MIVGLFIPVSFPMDEPREVTFIQQIYETQQNPVRLPVKRLSVPEVQAAFDSRFDGSDAINRRKSISITFEKKEWMGPVPDGLMKCLLQLAVWSTGGTGHFSRCEPKSDLQKAWAHR